MLICNVVRLLAPIPVVETILFERFLTKSLTLTFEREFLLFVFDL